MSRAKRVNVIVGFVGFLLVLLALACFVLLLSLQVDALWEWYDKFLAYSQQLEQWVLAVEPRALFAVVMLLLFTLRSVLPLLSFSALCLMTGVVLPMYVALPLNVVGICICLVIRYFWGKWRGGGRAWRIVIVNTPVRRLLERDGAGNPWLLFACRLLPSFPLNTISRIYGAMQFPFWQYMGISLLGFAPKLLSYTLIGKNAFDPLSAAFLTPLIVVLLLSGLSLMFVNTIWSFVDKNVRINTADRTRLRIHRKNRINNMKKAAREKRK